MTGFGEAHHEQDGSSVTVEVRTINSRFLKLTVRAWEGLGALEPKIEAVVRKKVRRGAVQVNLRIDQARSADDFRINTDVLDGYRRQLDPLRKQWDLTGQISLDSLLTLPGVIDENAAAPIDAEGIWPTVKATVDAALESLGQMRAEEGRTMADDLKAKCQTIAESLGKIQSRAPQVVEAYRERLEERLTRVLGERDIELDPADLIREVALFADRGDISEETVRLQSHLDQFHTTMALPESTGRKLEFLTQEMLRETNTIGAKANDVEIAREVIEIKSALEKIREMIQNIE